MLELLLSDAKTINPTISYRFFNFSQDLTYEEYFNFIKNYTSKHTITVQFIPRKFLTEELCNFAVKICVNNLEFIPKQFRIKELCEIAVSTSGFLIRSVPEKFITYELCKTAVTEDSYAIQYIPEIYLTKELCDIAIKTTGAAACIPTKILLKHYTKM